MTPVYHTNPNLLRSRYSCHRCNAPRVISFPEFALPLSSGKGDALDKGNGDSRIKIAPQEERVACLTTQITFKRLRRELVEFIFRIFRISIIGLFLVRFVAHQFPLHTSSCMSVRLLKFIQAVEEPHPFRSLIFVLYSSLIC